ncbi:protein Star-like isoform X2 [Macrobrachium rosenbergii]|uniref:protein Star-like isoform X2 n=1 Tax=Macrobrachium rosenbergii TaxID=79674 RepID=UPI0034D4D9BA
MKSRMKVIQKIKELKRKVELGQEMHSLGQHRNVVFLAMSILICFYFVSKKVPIKADEKSLKETDWLHNCFIPEYDLEGAAQDDPRLIGYIRRELLKPPSPHPYKLNRPKEVHYSQYNQSEFANKILNGMEDGFYIEVGASEGELFSNSLFFERRLGWRGLLIEPLKEIYDLLEKKNRKAYTINTALSTTPHASYVTFQPTPGFGTHSHLSNSGIIVKGIPLYSILRALDVKVVDFMSLDIEAFEVKVLKTIPWDKVTFRLMCIEVAHIPEGVDYLTEYLTDKGYKFLGLGIADAWYGWPNLLPKNTLINK